MKPTLQFYTDPREFKTAVYPFLLQNEAQNCIGLGLIDNLINHPGRYPEFSLVAVLEKGEVAGMAWITPPYPFGLTLLPVAAIPLLVDFALTLKQKPTAVSGPVESAKAYAERFGEVVQCGHKIKFSQGVYALTQVSPLSSIGGHWRVAEERDRELLANWFYGFCVECDLMEDIKPASEFFAQAIKAGNRFVWEVAGRVVSMAGIGGNTPNGIRITSVYTPPELRGHGYATALVAAVSQRQLDQGKRFCFLYTDLTNPTSNRIYQKIGYRHVCDAAYYTFEYKG